MLSKLFSVDHLLFNSLFEILVVKMAGLEDDDIPYSDWQGYVKYVDFQSNIFTTSASYDLNWTEQSRDNNDLLFPASILSLFIKYYSECNRSC